MNPTRTTYPAPKRVFVTLSPGSHLDLKQASSRQCRPDPGQQQGLSPVRSPFPTEFEMTFTHVFISALIVVVTFEAAAPLASHGRDLPVGP